MLAWISGQHIVFPLMTWRILLKRIIKKPEKNMSSKNQNNQPPQIRQLSDVKDQPFQIVSYVEKILQGWNKKIKKSNYLFKTNNGVWGYYNPRSRKVEEDLEWKDESVNIDGSFVPMSLYYRWHIRFFEPIEISVWERGRMERIDTQEAMVNLPEEANLVFEKEMEGKPPETWYKFTFATKPKRGGGEITYLDGVISAQ